MRYRFDIQKLLYLIGAVSILLASIGLLSVSYQLKGSLSLVRNNIQHIEWQITTSRLKIIYPINGGIVEPFDFVHGGTPYHNMNIYIVVTLPETGKTWIEAPPVKVFTDGLWTGKIKYDKIFPTSEKFILRAMTTKSTLPEFFAELPKDTILSEPIIVFRRN